MAVRAVLAVGLVAVLIAVVIALTDTGPRQAGTNHVPEAEEAVKLRNPASHCQDGQLVPKDAAALRLVVGTYGRLTPAIAVTARADGRTLTHGRLGAGQPEGHVTVPLSSVERTTPGARVCIRIGGEGRTVLYGLAGQVRLEWLRPGSESWFSLLGTVGHRFGLSKANPLGGALLVGVALLLLFAWASAIRLMLREVGSS